MFHGNNSGFTLLELIVVLTIIGTMSMFVAPLFTISENTPQKQFAPFLKFIENQRGEVIASGKPRVLRFDTAGKITALATLKNKKGKYPVLQQQEFTSYLLKTTTGEKEKSSIVIMPNGTTEAFSLGLDNIKKQLIFNGTVARGKIL